MFRAEYKHRFGLLTLLFCSWCLLVQAAMFFAALGKETKLLALAKADRGFVGQRNISGGEGDINSASGRGETRPYLRRRGGLPG